MNRNSLPLAGLVVAAWLGGLGAMARAGDFHVDPVVGIDDAMLADGSPGQPWRTLSFTLNQVPAAGSHVIHLAAGVYSLAGGETLPIRLPSNVSLEGDPAGGTVLLDTRNFGAPTILWQVRPPDSLDGTNAIRRLAIRRETGGPRAGRGIAIDARDTSAAPALDGLTISGGESGIDLLSDSDTGATSVAPIITNCVVTDNDIGLLATAYTHGGAASEADPVLTNNVFAGNVEGLVFETLAAYGLPTAARRNAKSTASLRHCTLAGNVGSGIVLDDTNLGASAAGPCRPAVVNCIVSAAGGDYGINEFSSSSFPSPLDNNMFEPGFLGFYRSDGRTDLLTIGEVNALASASANFEGAPAFLRDTAPSWRLRADSPGVDSAQPSGVAVDFEGDPRPSDSDLDGLARSEVGFDETAGCAVSASVSPADPADRCGVFGPLDFDAEASAITAGFPDCSVPLDFQWFLDGEALPGETTPFLSVTPDRSGVYEVRVSCADAPHCADTASVPVRVFELPTVSAGGPWSACLPAGQDSVALDLLGLASPPAGAAITAWDWSTMSPLVSFLGGATPAPIVVLDGYADFANLAFDVTLTATDSNGCAATSDAVVEIWRGPIADAGGPYLACQDEGARSFIPLQGGATTPAGSAIVAWSWSTSIGEFDDATSRTPNLIRNNVPFPVSSRVSVTVTDDHGCSATSPEVLVTLHPNPTANSGGPYQLQEDVSGTTSFDLDGSLSAARSGALAFSWSTDLGAFVPPSADAALVRLDVTNTGVDQVGTVCLTVTDEEGCDDSQCTGVSVKADPLQPPNDVGPTLRIDTLVRSAQLSWFNAPLDATHDRADRYEIWTTDNALPDLGGWSVRVADVPPLGGVSVWLDSALLDLAGPDLIHLKVVARNDAGASCVMPPAPRVTLDADCP